MAVTALLLHLPSTYAGKTRRKGGGKKEEPKF